MNIKYVVFWVPQKVMDPMVEGFAFGSAKCYIYNIIIFSLTLRKHMQHLQKVFD
jgi:hypothetical protein